MGRQVNFFLNAEDQKDFVELLGTWENLVFLPDRSLTGKATIPDQGFRTCESDDLSLYLVRKEDLHEVKFYFLPNQNCWYVDSLRSPVIQYSRCYATDSLIRRGRLYFQPGYYEESDWVEKDHAFVAWADRIIKTVRRKLRLHKLPLGSNSCTEYLGKSTLLWAQENKALLQSGGSELVLEAE